MRKLALAGLIVLVGAAVFYGFPLLYEHAATTCVAFEKRLLTAPPSKGTSTPDRALDALRAAFMSGLQHLSDGSVATELARERHPDWSPRLGCAVEYWRSLVVPAAAPPPAS